MVKAILHLLFSFRGRISVGQWWFGLVVPMGISVVAAVPIPISEVLGGVVGILMFWILFAINTKRLHDRNLPGWWILIALIPILGTIYCGWQIAILPGDEGINRYGPPPKTLFKFKKEPASDV